MKEMVTLAFIVFLAIAIMVTVSISVGNKYGQEHCANLATNAEVETSYFDGACHIKVCDAWINQADLPYLLNRAKSCP